MIESEVRYIDCEKQLERMVLVRKYIVFLISLSICLLVGSSIYKVYAMEEVNDGYLVSSHTTTAIEHEIQFNQELEAMNEENLLHEPEYKYKTVSGYIGNQFPGCPRPSGAGFSVPLSKIYVDRTLEIRPYVTYRTGVGTNKWELFNSGAAVFFRKNAYAKKVN